jgi:hypothetical protein
LRLLLQKQRFFFFSFFFLFRSERFGACQVRARLIADVRDVGEGVLTGARVGEVKILFVVIFVFEKKKKKKKKKKKSVRGNLAERLGQEGRLGVGHRRHQSGLAASQPSSVKTRKFFFFFFLFPE